MGPVGTGDWGLGLGLDNKNVKIQHLDFLLFVCLIFISAFRDSEDLQVAA